MKRLHDKKIDDAKYYEKIWSDEFNARPYYDDVRMRCLIKDVKDGDKVIDIGAGVFGSAQYIAENTDLKCDLYAYDQSYTAKEIVDNLKLPITYLLGSCEGKLPFKDNEFDVVIAGEIIEHIENPDYFVSELKRIGKKVAISTVDTNCQNAKNYGDYPEHIWEFTIDDLKKYGEYETCGDYHIVRCG